MCTKQLISIILKLDAAEFGNASADRSEQSMNIVWIYHYECACFLYWTLVNVYVLYIVLFSTF